MPHLVLARLVTAEPMGQQLYEEAILDRAQSALGPSWSVAQADARSLRSPCPGTVRIPSAILQSATGTARRLVGRYIYRKSDLVHRFDLRLPPADAEVLMIHDVTPWRFPDEASPPPAAITEARRARRVICPSQFSADEIVKVLKVANPAVIPNGVAPEAFESRPLSGAELEALGLRPPFVLHTGGCTLRKNLRSLSEAWPLVRSAVPDATLALVGAPDPRRSALFSGVSGAVLLGRLDSNLLARVRTSAACLVIPSLYEGFGLPALEGMAAGVPVVATQRSSLPEVCADGAILVEPTPAGLAEGVIHALHRDSSVEDLLLRAQSVARSHTWERSATAHATIWREAIA